MVCTPCAGSRPGRATEGPPGSWLACHHPTVMNNPGQPVRCENGTVSFACSGENCPHCCPVNGCRKAFYSAPAVGESGMTVTSASRRFRCIGIGHGNPPLGAYAARQCGGTKRPLGPRPTSLQETAKDLSDFIIDADSRVVMMRLGCDSAHCIPFTC